VGFDWIAHAAWFNANPWAIVVLNNVYMSIVGAMMVVLGMLVVMRRYVHFREVLLINDSLSLLGIVFCTFLPAIGAYAYYSQAADLVGNIPSAAGRYHLEHFNGLRGGELLSFNYDETKGIITFPSVPHRRPSSSTMVLAQNMAVLAGFSGLGDHDPLYNFHRRSSSGRCRCQHNPARNFDLALRKVYCRTCIAPNMIHNSGDGNRRIKR